ncbi:MAG: Hsp70 family protein [Austwickia sp.]|nr:Hsp70 family protein [Austwickia sp.]MBK8435255.1 Hsp70 family protein [Austwickia sp.]MBK9101193.1 Hsp70 family protein [Austwickia sp.]
MRLGVDFGTTRTIVASVDRGNYPVVSFQDPAGDAHEYYPSVVAWEDDRLSFGFEALAAGERGAPMVRSFKRALASPDVNPETTIAVGDQDVRILDVMTGFFESLRQALESSSSVRGGKVADIQAAVAVPAHAHGPQRFLTLEAFRRAGFEVSAMINEPSAAGFEYTHRQGRTVTSRRTRVIVYDLGGGTFDASLVNVDGKSHEVIDSLGLNHLGGDDFDVVLGECALMQAGISREALPPRAFAELVEECREAKEQLAPQSKRIALEVDGSPLMLKVEDFYASCAPLVEATVEAMRPLVGGLDEGSPLMTDIAGIYLVGGASSLPLVPRVLRERFGRRVHRSPYPAASTAIGLAIAADATAGYSLTDRLSRGFGVFREARDGQSLAFDPILPREAKVTSQEAVMVSRAYPAFHNVGWFRFVEYSTVDAAGQPRGDIVPFAEVIFPFDPALQGKPANELRAIPVRRADAGHQIEERYVIDPHGIIEVHLRDLHTGYTQKHALAAPGPRAEQTQGKGKAKARSRR